MADTKKQHFIPQFLLKNFAHGKKKKERLWTFDKQRKVAFQSSVRDTAHENQFYAGQNLDGETIEAESLTAYIDERGSKVLRAIVDDQRLPLAGEPFVSLSYFVATQMVRVPTVRNQMEFLRKTVIEKWGPEIRAEGDERGIGEYSEEDSKFSSIASLRNVPEIAKILQTKIWFLDQAPTDASFILSDNPVVKHNYIDYWPRGSLGIGQDGIEIHFSISPKLLVKMLCPKIAASLSLTPLGREVIPLQREGRAIPLEAENVEFVNSLQVARSERYLYAERESHLQIAKEMVSEHPDLARPLSAKIVAK